MSIYYAEPELRNLGIPCGENVRIHRSVCFFGDNVTIGSNVRIDCFCVITSKLPVTIGSYVHLGIGVTILGAGGVVIEDFAGLSPKVSVFTTSDDYTGGHLTNPTVPFEYRKVKEGPVRIGRHAIVGASTVILPGVSLGKGASVGALCLVRKSIPDFAVAAGSPTRIIGQRDRSKLAQFEALIVSG
jgi:acetyltransferase-like isoleucine patch superfamily enzyme